MPKTTNTKKKPATKFGGGGVGTRVSKLNLKIVIPIVALVAALGGFYIFRKSSASSYTFTYGPGNWNISGGQYVNKGAGKDYRILNWNNNHFVKVNVPAAQWHASGDFCVHYTGGDGKARVIVGAEGNYIPGTGSWGGFYGQPSGYVSGSGNVCVGRAKLQELKNKPGQIAQVTKDGYGVFSVGIDIPPFGNTPRIGQVTFDNVYGKP